MSYFAEISRGSFLCEPSAAERVFLYACGLDQRGADLYGTAVERLVREHKALVTISGASSRLEMDFECSVPAHLRIEMASASIAEQRLLDRLTEKDDHTVSEDGVRVLIAPGRIVRRARRMQASGVASPSAQCCVVEIEGGNAQGSYDATAVSVAYALMRAITFPVMGPMDLADLHALMGHEGATAAVAVSDGFAGGRQSDPAQVHVPGLGPGRAAVGALVVIFAGTAFSMRDLNQIMAMVMAQVGADERVHFSVMQRDSASDYTAGVSSVMVIRSFR